MSILISDEILQAARITEAELGQEIALMLFQQERFITVKGSHEQRMTDEIASIDPLLVFPILGAP